MHYECCEGEKMAFVESDDDRKQKVTKQLQYVTQTHTENQKTLNLTLFKTFF